MSLGLSHSLSRYKLKFSPEKVDTMIVQVSMAGTLSPICHDDATLVAAPGTGRRHLLLDNCC
jgi:hypothetical protein